MSASSLRYEPRPDRNANLRAEIIRLAHRYKRYGAGMIYLKLRQDGWGVTGTACKLWSYGDSLQIMQYAKVG